MAKVKLRSDTIRKSTLAVSANSSPTLGLTLKRELGSEPFVGMLPEANKILEIGPGYGRLIDGILGRPFSRYVGYEVSAKSTEHLREKYAKDPRISIVNADAEDGFKEQGFNLAYGSLVFPHMYPDFWLLARNIRKVLVEGGFLCFDVVESLLTRDHAFNVVGGFVRRYHPDEIRGILYGAGFTDVSLTKFSHDGDPPELAAYTQYFVKAS